jgi:hypothetical protein
LAVGFGVGYYLGARAGRERYLQMRRWINRASESDFVDAATDKAKAVVDLGVERARDLVDRSGTDADDDTSEIVDVTGANLPEGQGNGQTSPGYSPSR